MRIFGGLCEEPLLKCAVARLVKSQAMSRTAAISSAQWNRGVRFLVDKNLKHYKTASDRQVLQKHTDWIFNYFNYLACMKCIKYTINTTVKGIFS